jgi:adenylate cyclase class 2
MAIETEVKLRVDDPASLRRRLEELGAEVDAPRHFEDNFVLDFPGGTLRARGCLIRLRMAGTESILTYKGPARAEGPFKSREEVETRVEDCNAMLDVLGRLGLTLWFRYQKFREQFRLQLSGEPGESTLHIALDETPVGSYAEVEGSEASIRLLASRLGYSELDFLRDSYYALYLRFCQERGCSAGHMTFADAS